MACGRLCNSDRRHRPDGGSIVHFATDLTVMMVPASRFVTAQRSALDARCGDALSHQRRSYHSLITNSLPSLPTIMSAGPSTSSSTSTSTSRSNFVSIFNAALESYKRKTKRDLASHPLLPSLQSCDSPEAILTVLREQIPVLSQSQNADDGLTKWVTPTVNVLYAFSAMLGQGVGSVNIKISPREEFLL